MSPERTLRNATAVGAAVLAIGAALDCSPRTASPVGPSAAPLPAASAAAAELRFDVRAVDRRVDPCVDFYDFACGGWRATHPIPPDRTRWSRYAEMEAANLNHLRAIAEHAGADGGASPAEVRVGAHYAACMDEPAIEARGLAPIRDLTASIDAMSSPAQVAELVASLHAHVAYVLFDLSVEPDVRDAGRVVATLDSGALGMDAAAYARTDDRSKQLRDAYGTHVAQVLKLLGSADPAADARRVVALETRLAASLPPPAERRNSESQVHPMTGDEIAARAPAFDWQTYFSRAGLPSPVRANVNVPAWLDAVSAALSTGDLADVRAYMRYHVANKLKALLPVAVDDAFFDFQQRTLRGAREKPARWKRCLGLLNDDLGDDMGRLFVARYFPAASRDRATAIVRSVVATFRADLAANDWLSPAARQEAVKKLDNHLFQVGYPARWKSYDGLMIDRNDPAGNAERARALTVARELATLGHPTDRDDFSELAQDLDAFGSKSRVSTGFTAGFLQPPVFDPSQDDAVTYGGFGAVAGHELTHQFDDEGRKYDVNGSVRSWWSPEDVARYEERARCVADEYSRFHIDDGTAVDGKLTLGENIADAGGLRLAWETARPSATAPAIDGFTLPQRLFLSWGQIRCENATPEAARRQVESDPHSPGRWRVDGVVANMPEFAEAFACKAGSPMAPATRCRVW